MLTLPSVAAVVAAAAWRSWAAVAGAAILAFLPAPYLLYREATSGYEPQSAMGALLFAAILAVPGLAFAGVAGAIVMARASR